MPDTLNILDRKVHSAQEMKQVVRTMKSLAAASIRPYEQAVHALQYYRRTVELGLIASFGDLKSDQTSRDKTAGASGASGFVVFGSDQGLVGQFNESLASFFDRAMSDMVGEKLIWPVGDRMVDQLQQAGCRLESPYRVPDSVAGIIPLISEILLDLEYATTKKNLDRIFIFHNRPQVAALYEPVQFRLLPLDDVWLAELATKKWPTRTIPEVFLPADKTRAALIREYLLISLFQACAESLASENASRLASMQRAEKNINEMLEQLQLQYHRLRQNMIDEDLFDVISGYEALL